MIYLLHFDVPFKHARHYLGWTKDGSTLEARLEHHLNGDGANILKWAGRAGVTWRLSRTWPDGDKATERRLKNSRHVPRLCPECRPTYNAARRQKRLAQRGE